VFVNLVNLVNFDLERCLKIHGGLVHVKGTTHTSEHHLFNYYRRYLIFWNVVIVFDTATILDSFEHCQHILLLILEFELQLSFQASKSGVT
jgi:hypothetical protein